MRALGAYIFAGGFTLGVRRHFDVLGHLEETDYGTATVKANMPDVPTVFGVERWAPFVRSLGEARLDLLYGNPPCAAWSQAGAKKNRDWRSDARVDCTRRHFSLLEEHRPRAWVWESVTQAYTDGREFVEELTARAVAMGYSVAHVLHDAQHLGVPQVRKRFMFVATDCAFNVKVEDRGTVACGAALSALNDPGEPVEAEIAKFKDLVRLMEPGEDLRQTWERLTPKPWETNRLGQVKGRPSFLTKRPRPDRPANVVMKEMVHPTEPRGLSMREMAVLCGFPPMYEFERPNPSLIAQGVCPPVGAWIAENIRRCLERDEKEGPTVRTIDVRKPPGAGAPSRVPAIRTVQPAKPERPAAGGLRVGDVRPKNGMGSGAYIRLLLSMGFEDAGRILELNSKHFPQSKAKASDVYWNRKKLECDRQAVPAPAPQAPEPHVPQPTRISRRTGSPPSHVDQAREYDTSSLDAKGYGYRVHRDYAAHFFRWGFARRFVNNGKDVLEVGCGVDTPFVKSLVGAYPSGVPRSYVGVDINRLKEPPSRPWALYLGEFNFVERHAEIGTFDVVICLEVIEHMTKAHGGELLSAIRRHMRENGVLLLSTPVFNGTAAANHVHEYTAEELAGSIAAAGFAVEARYGTFANYRDIKKVATPEQVATLDGLSRFYASDVTACFLAPLYPDASRNNVWVLKRA